MQVMCQHPTCVVGLCFMVCACMCVCVCVCVCILQSLEQLLGVTVGEDFLGSLEDGIVLCQLMNKLHPGTITHFHTPADDQVCPHSHSQWMYHAACADIAC